ncbi:MAG: hypothetical protein LW822_10735 [Phycisphaeraceae bacterium]|nr:hypothetical protein [Phycisphaeraceae bacterium]
MSDTATSVESPSAPDTIATNAGDTAVLENAPAADAAATDAGLGGDGQSNPDAGDELLARMMGIDTGADADAAESTPEPEGKAGAVVLSDEEAIAARTVLARLGWDAEDILAMSPAKLKAKADKYGAHVARTDEAFKSVKKLAQVQKELEDLRAKTAPDPLAGFKAKYASLIDPEDLEALAGVVKVKAKAQTKPEADDGDGAAPAADEARTRLARLLVAENRESLKGQYPQLADEKKLAALYSAFDRLDPDGQTIEDPVAFAETFRTAAMLAFGHSAKGTARDELMKRNRDRRDGQPEAKGTHPSAKPVLTADDVARTSAELFITDPRNAASRTAEMWARLKGSA